MSASLVGSEMCIRDRFEASDAPGCARNRTRRRRQGKGNLVGATTDTSAVSYTHLTLPTICSV
eukprot:9691582-Alexandrium_andersonii.AAC.1